MNKKRDLTFRELRGYLSMIDRLSVCMVETGDYENFLRLEDVPERYDSYYIYGVGMIESEFYKTDDTYAYATGGKQEDLVFLHCMEIVLSKEPKNVVIKRDKEALMNEP